MAGQTPLQNGTDCYVDRSQEVYQEIVYAGAESTRYQCIS